ncbi:MAG: glutamate formimidoyltransferase [Christensenellales bacterium]
MACVPNYSEGRDLDKVERLLAPFRGRSQVKLLDYSSDADHNRSVATVVGEPEALGEAVAESIGLAVSLIDMTRHQGQHPRMGCVDVVPFIPLRNCTMEDADRVARRVAALCAERFHQPFFLYEKSAATPLRENLADIRRGEFEGMAQKMLDPAWRPDFGPATIHPTGGVTAIGARLPLIAFNVLLNTADVAVAKAIAARVRHSGGGLKCVKALGLYLAHRGLAQVSMNLTDYTQTSLYQAFEMVRMEARRFGAQPLSSELIGLAPMAALAESAAYYLQIEHFSMDKVLEHRMMEL